jgi:hypothetical protein
LFECERCNHHYVNDLGKHDCQYGHIVKGKAPKKCSHYSCENCDNHYTNSKGKIDCQYGHIVKGKAPKWCQGFRN